MILLVYWDLNSRPLGHESLPITTKTGLPLNSGFSVNTLAKRPLLLRVDKEIRSAIYCLFF